MTCHQELYRRSPAAPFENLTFTDYAGVPHTWRLPVEDAQGNFQYVINESQDAGFRGGGGADRSLSYENHLPQLPCLCGGK